MKRSRIRLRMLLALSLQAAGWVGLTDLLVGSLRAEPPRDPAPRQASLAATGRPLLSGPPTVQLNAIGRAPLAAIVQLQTSEAARVELEISDGDRSWRQPAVEVVGPRQLPVLGLRPGRSHTIHIQLQAVSDGRREIGGPLQFDTSPLPDDFPPLRTVLANSQQMQPGITMFPVNLWADNISIVDYGYLIAVDSAGQVIWYCDTADRMADFRPLRNGHLLYQHASYRYLYEIDLLGRDIRSWYAARTTAPPNAQAIGVEVDTLHHEVMELPSGNFLTLATELRRFESFPTSETDPTAAWQPAWVVGDEVVEFEPASGRIVHRLPLTELLDPRRFGYLSLSGFWRDKYDDYLDAPARDWSHANALDYLEDEAAILVSLRHLDCVLKIDWPAGRLRWILGDPAGWSEPFQSYLLQADGQLQWPYHQHAVHRAADGTILMFDNGNYRAVPFSPPLRAPDNSSRVVAYRVDEAALRVRQVYSYGAEQGERFYSPFYGHAERLEPTGHLLITDGGRIETAEGVPYDEVPGQRQWARLFEITGEEPPRKVFELICASPPSSRLGWSIYRSHRFPSLSDPFRVVPPLTGEESRVLARPPIAKLNPLKSYQPVTVSPSSGHPLRQGR